MNDIRFRVKRPAVQTVRDFFCFTLHARNQKMMPKNGLCLWAMIMMNEKKMNESPKYKCFIGSSLCSANERIYIFSEKRLIVSVNKGLKASYRLNREKERHSELAVNKLSEAA